MDKANKTILVFGATGRMGGATARHLCRSGWHVRGVTRNPESESAKALTTQGIDLVQGDMENPDSLRLLFKDVYGIFLVVNGFEVGFEAEVRQGKHVADLAAEASIQHLVFGAAGTGKHGTGLSHFESKVDIVEYLQSKHIPSTTIYPPPFMELMTDPTLYPQLGTWNAKMKIVGEDLPIPWIATDDIGALAALIFNNPDVYMGQELKPVADWKTLGECRQLYREIAGKNPFRIPLPLWLMRRMIPELVQMWEWMLETEDLEKTRLEPLLDIYANTTDVQSFLQQKLLSN